MASSRFRSEPPEVEVPKRIGRYDVERLLGQGGMGRVWLARDTVLGRNVAIKTLRDDLALPPSVKAELVTRMRHEAQAAAAVSHPSIVTLHDMGEDDGADGSDGVGLYLVFEYVAGPRGDGPESLRDRLREGQLPLATVATLARDLGSALTFAHGAGVIHRDIKPENILFSRTGAKIADFGIARIPDSTITRANTVLGTPAYTAPEALSKGDFGPGSDQFALATTLYEAATGARAFGSDDPIVTAGKVSNEPPPPLEATLGTEKQVRGLTAALQKGMAKDVGARFGSCADLGEAVSRAIERPELTSIEALALRDENGGSDLIEIERTPLSSRVSVVERARRSSDRPVLTPYGETPTTTNRPSIMIRKQTHRLQNIIAAAALLVIVALVVIGRKTNEEGGGAFRETAKALASAVASASASAAAANASASAPKPHAARPHPKPSATPSADAAAGPAPTSAAGVNETADAAGARDD